jgi:hypothetical protein
VNVDEAIREAESDETDSFFARNDVDEEAVTRAGFDFGQEKLRQLDKNQEQRPLKRTDLGVALLDTWLAAIEVGMRMAGRE